MAPMVYACMVRAEASEIQERIPAYSVRWGSRLLEVQYRGDRRKSQWYRDRKSELSHVQLRPPAQADAHPLEDEGVPHPGVPTPA